MSATRCSNSATVSRSSYRSVEMRVIARDGARAFQRPQAAVARRHAQPHALGELGERQPAVALQLGKDLPINVIHGEDSSTPMPIVGEG
jgi:hypothetical protein